LGFAVNCNETDLGFEIKTLDFFAFFGKKESSLENLQRAYPQFEFRMLSQVHGNTLVNSTFDSENNSVKADAHWTGDKNLALISKSADCIPILGYCESEQRVLAIHAGWRGVQNLILPLSLKQLGGKWDLFIGPHITQNSFEIQDDCFSLLKKSTILNSGLWFSGGKADLFKIVMGQLDTVADNVNSVESLIFDSKTDLRFHSFRRDGASAGRQNSFIALLG
jgi:polyphenol oxidase